MKVNSLYFPPSSHQVESSSGASEDRRRRRDADQEKPADKKEPTDAGETKTASAETPSSDPGQILDTATVLRLLPRDARPITKPEITYRNGSKRIETDNGLTPARRK